MKIFVGVIIGSIVGGVIGHFGKCRTGACPLTSTPIRGALYGAFIGLMIALM